MKKIVIKEEVLNKRKITLNQFIALLSIYIKHNDADIEKLKVAQLIDVNLSGIPFIIPRGIKFIESIIIESMDNPKMSKEDIIELAKELRELFPTGKKPGTNNYWRGNVAEIRDRLIVFFDKHGNFDKELIIKATKKYVDSFDGDTTLMRTLKYFISKRNHDMSYSYDLLTYIENIDAKDDSGVLNVSRII